MLILKLWQITLTAATLKLPLPPSVNVYYAKNRHLVYISEAGRQYRSLVGLECVAQGMQRFGDARIALWVDIHPADKRKSDLDNRLKSLCDALMAANVFDDDSQIDEIVIRRKPIIKFGLCVVQIKGIEHEANGQSNPDAQ